MSLTGQALRQSEERQTNLLVSPIYSEEKTETDAGTMITQPVHCKPLSQFTDRLPGSTMTYHTYRSCEQSFG